MRGLITFGVPLLAALALFTHPAPADACSGCSQPGLVPGPDGTVAPINALGVLWGPYPITQPLGDDDLPRLFEVGSGLELALEQVPLGPDIYLVPGAALELGESYRFEVPESGCVEATSRTLVAGEPLEFPAGLGVLTATEPSSAPITLAGGVGCSEQVDVVYVRVELELVPALAPFEELLMYETYVDGERWRPTVGSFDEPAPGETWRGRGVDLIYATCNDGVGGSAEPHLVQMRARLAGAPEIAIETEPIEVVLNCATEDMGESETGGETGDGPGADEDSGCSCSSAGDSGRAGLLGLLMLLGLPMLGRNRTHRSSCSP